MTVCDNAQPTISNSKYLPYQFYVIAFVATTYLYVPCAAVPFGVV